MKLKTIAVVCGCVFASHSYALNPATTTAAATIPLFISGSSSLQATIGQVATGLFVPGTIDVYFDAAGNGANYRAYSGTFSAAAGAALAGKNGVVYEMAKGGSMMGIIPVALASATAVAGTPAQILDLNTCTSTGTLDAVTNGRLWSCTGAINAVPDAGVSDVEPALFVGINAAAGSVGVTGAIARVLLPMTSLAQLVGIVLTPNVLFGTSALSSLSKAQIGGLMSGVSSDWSYADSTIAPGPVTVCRRVAGSGTQAVINNAIGGFPCSPTSWALSTAQATPGGYTVIENNSSGALASCMTAVMNGTTPGYTIDIRSGAIGTAAADATHIVLPPGGRAIGMMALNRQPGVVTNAGINGSSATVAVPEAYRFISVNGMAPSVENAVVGNYDIVFNNSWSSRSVAVNGIAPLSGDKLAFYMAMVNNSGNPAILGAAKTPPVPGVAALANSATLNFDPTTAVFNGQTILLNPVMRTFRSNSCQPAFQVQ